MQRATNWQKKQQILSTTVNPNGRKYKFNSNVKWRRANDISGNGGPSFAEGYCGGLLFFPKWWFSTSVLEQENIGVKGGHFHQWFRSHPAAWPYTPEIWNRYWYKYQKWWFGKWKSFFNMATLGFNSLNIKGLLVASFQIHLDRQVASQQKVDLTA